MFRIKICGITNLEDALAAVAAGADAIGFNFYARSKRYVDTATAQQIRRALPNHALAVGVFVNASGDKIARIAAQVGLEAVQLHGDEPAQIIDEIPPRLSIVRAYRCTSAGLTPLQTYLDECRSYERKVAAVLVDADAGDAFGGTGRVADWSRIANERALINDLPLLLSGGLTPDNVAEAIRTVRPHGVDVASGVERSPGVKDPRLVERFVQAAKQALENLV